MPDRLSEVVEKAELAVASSSGVVDQELLDPMIDLLKTIRIRMSYPDEVSIVALAGGTGSGKSSLFNALAGADLVEVGGMRPTTSAPAVAVPRSIGHRMDGLLDHLGLRRRYEHDGQALCIVDLPDTDSVEVEHHQQVDRVIPYVDAVVWVTDPEKYRDARLHKDYLSPLSDYSAGFVVVLNQIDRLDETQLGEVIDDLESALEEDGLSGVDLVPVAAAPSAGPPIGLETLVDTLGSMRSSRDLVGDKLLTDLGLVAKALAASAGVGVDFDVKAEDSVDQAVTHLANGDRDGAIDILTTFLDGIVGDVGGSTGRAIARHAAEVPAHIARIVSESESTSGRGWVRRRRSSLDTGAAAKRITAAVIRPVRAELAKRAVALASVADLAVEIESLRSTKHR